MRVLSMVIALACFFSATLPAQDLQEGTWSGTVVRIGAGRNPQPQRVSLEVKKAPDPHAAWRPGKGEVWNVMFVLPQGRSQATNLRLENGSLSFSHKRADILHLTEESRLTRERNPVWSVRSSDSGVHLRQRGCQHDQVLPVARRADVRVAGGQRRAVQRATEIPDHDVSHAVGVQGAEDFTRLENSQRSSAPCEAPRALPR